ncbi:MAG: SMI1/KNR4 family protein [Polyangiaceae bacterium]|jgi:hypothetical protein|nr:SMI1/KNR4 family protein [Polyangiaceae bacterium]
MRKTINDLIAVVESTQPHVVADGEARQDLDRFTARSGFALPSDLTAFYERISSATLVESYQMLPPSAWVRTGAALQGPEWAESEPPSWYAFCDAFDGNYIGIDLATTAAGANPILDCDHDDVRERRVIANSFTEFLTEALRSPDRPFYLGVDFQPITTVHLPYNPPLSWLRREYHRWSVDPEVGPETCRHPGCARLHVHLSVLCRRHHFENIQRLPYPFDD